MIICGFDLSDDINSINYGGWGVDYTQWCSGTIPVSVSVSPGSVQRTICDGRDQSQIGHISA